MALIINNNEVPCAVQVLDWHSHGMECKIGDGARKRNIQKTEIDLFVLHWTAGEGGAKACFDVLDQRELGVEFCIDVDGIVYQFADPALVDTFDAGAVNPRSVGVEITNYGFRDHPSEIPAKGRNRPIYDTVIRGKPRKLAAFNAKQIRAAIALVDAVTVGISTIPRQIAMSKDGSKVFSDTMTKKQLASYRGVIGHFQISESKSDPGTDILQEFAALPRYRHVSIG